MRHGVLLLEVTALVTDLALGDSKERNDRW